MAAGRLEPAGQVGGVDGGVDGEPGGEQRLDAVDLHVERVVAEPLEAADRVVEVGQRAGQIAAAQVRHAEAVAHLGHTEVVALRRRTARRRGRGRRTPQAARRR